LNEIDQLEQELIALRQRFAQSAAVLEELYQIKGKFDNLIPIRRCKVLSTKLKLL
jgi:hypothetical protein